jgi:modulator of FtsH protease
MPTYEQLGFGGGAALTGDRARSVFGHVMGLVAVTVMFSALGAYLTRHSSGTSYFIFFIAAFGCLWVMGSAVRRGSEQLALVLLFGVGLLLGMAIGPIVNYYATTSPGVVYQAAGTTAVGVALLGAVGYTTRRDLSSWLKPLMIALIVVLVAGLIMMLLSVPGAYLGYCIAALVVIGGLTVFDFNRLARTGDHVSAIPIAAGIFLDIFNIFLLLLTLFGGGGSRR